MAFNRFLLVLAICCCLSDVYAQRYAPVFRHFGIEEGLPSITAYQFLMDSKGYGWVATTNGLSRFDGYHFNTFQAKEGLTDDVVVAIDEGEAGEIWILSNSGKVFQYAGDSIRACACNKVIQGYKDRFLAPHNIVWNPDDQYLYLSLAALGILKIKPDGSDHQLIRPEHKRDILCIRLGDRLLSEFRNYPDEELTGIPESDAGVEMHEYGLIKRTPGLQFSLPKIELGGMVEFGDDQFLVYRNGYFYWLEHMQITATVPFGSLIRDFQIGPDGALWVAMPDQRELRRYETVENLKHNEFQIVLSAGVRSFYFDWTGGLWVASIQEGIFYAPNPSINVLTNLPGVGSDHVTALCQSDRGGIFAGFTNGKQIEIAPQTLQTRELPAQEPADGMVNTNAWSPAYSELWAGKRALAVFTNGTWKNILLPAPPHSEPKPCRAASSIRLSPDKQRIWACSRQMLVGLDARTHDFLRLRKGSFEDILETRDGKVWVAAERGLFQLEDTTLLPQNRLHPALSSGVTSLLERKDGTLAVATKTGLLLWNTVKKQFELLTENDGLPENQLGALCESFIGSLWVGSFSGAARISLDATGKWRIQRYTTFDGLPANQITAILSMDNQIWIGTPKGIAVVEATYFPELPPPLSPAIKGIKINQKRLLGPIKALNCAYNENNIQLEFNNLFFPTGNQTLYRFRIQPHQPWEYAKQPEIAFYSLSPGSYQVEIAAADGQGVWSNSVVLPIHINPPFWQTWWFRLLVLLSVVIPALLFYRYRLKVLQREFSLREQSNELEKQALRAQMNPHFIFNCLNSIQDFILAHNQAAASEYLAKFARLIRQVLDQSFQKSISLESELEYLENYLQLEAMRFKGTFRYEIHVDPDLEPAFSPLPPMLVQPFVENAVLHGMRGKKSGGVIELRFEALHETGLKIQILDNGPGFPMEQAGSTGHISHGSGLAIKRLSLLQEHPGAGISLQNRPEGGAQVLILLPG